MRCMKCDHDLDGCTCPDLAERMRRLSGPGGAVASRWCAGCDKHYAACRCEQPDWKLRVGGQLQGLPAGAFPPDLSKGGAA